MAKDRGREGRTPTLPWRLTIAPRLAQVSVSVKSKDWMWVCVSIVILGGEIIEHEHSTHVWPKDRTRSRVLLPFRNVPLPPSTRTHPYPTRAVSSTPWALIITAIVLVVVFGGLWYRGHSPKKICCGIKHLVTGAVYNCWLGVWWHCGGCCGLICAGGIVGCCPCLACCCGRKKRQKGPR